MKRVLFVIPKLCNGGAERRVALLANELSHFNDLKISLLSFWETEEDYRLSKNVKRIHLWKRYRGNHHLSDKKRILNLFFIMLFRKFDIVFTMHPPVAYMVKISSFLKKIHIVDLLEVSPNHMKDIDRRKKGWKFCSKIVSQCNAQITYMPEEYKDKCITITNPVDDSFIDQQHIYNNNIRRFTSVGRLDKEKNHRLLIDAFKNVSCRHPDITLTIFGKGPLKEDLLYYCKENRISNISFIDRSDNMPQTYNEFDAFILSSDFEGMPNALIEAMAVGLPCISTNCDTGPSDLIISGVNGILVKVGDVNELQKAISDFCKNGLLVNEYGKKAKETVRFNNSKQQIIHEYYELINSLLLKS